VWERERESTLSSGLECVLVFSLSSRHSRDGVRFSFEGLFGFFACVFHTKYDKFVHSSASYAFHYYLIFIMVEFSVLKKFLIGGNKSCFGVSLFL